MSRQELWSYSAPDAPTQNGDFRNAAKEEALKF